MCRVAGQTGTVTVLQQTAREHNNPPALIKKQMMIEPTHNSRYSNNNNKYNKLYTTNNREHKTQKQKTNRDTHESKAKPKELLFVREYVLERTFRSELLDEEAGKGSRRREPMIIAHIEKHFLYLHYICIMQATCMT